MFDKIKTIDNRKNMGYPCTFVEQKDYSGDEQYVCSMCENIWVLLAGTPETNDWNYCPGCGSYIEKIEYIKYEEVNE
jgi:DNA-directed RNA polymerase subunit RPC12/RpoP